MKTWGKAKDKNGRIEGKTMTILIKNGRVVDPATGTDETLDLLIKDGVIAEREKNCRDKADETVDAKGCYVMPGFVDMHVHLRDPGFTEKETVETGAQAAARGGYTTIFAMPNTKPVADHADVVDYVHKKAKNLALVHVYQVGAVTRGQQGEELADIAGMVEAGIPAISEDGKSVMNAKLAKKAMLEAKKYGIPVLAHCEDKNLVDGGVVNADKDTAEYGLRGITNAVEDTIAARDIILAGETGAHLHLCHCSTKGSVFMVREAKKQHISVSAEVCPHHFTLTSAELDPANTNYKMNPPLRTAEDVEALKQGLKEGVMEVISTDHAPHTPADKNAPMETAAFGIVGLETAAALTHTELVLGGYLTPMQMAERMSYNPARIMGIDAGTLKEGAPADIVIFDPSVVDTIDSSKFWSKSKNTPFDGRKVTGEVKMTLVDGEIVYDRTNQTPKKRTQKTENRVDVYISGSSMR